MKLLKIILTSLIFFSFKLASAQVDPSIEWKTIQTEHFSVVFDAQQKAIGEAYAARLEAIYGTLKTVFTQLPTKTVVVINDMTDSPNGWATRIPYPTIMAFPVIPAAGESISEFGDWPQELLLHEYVHILSFEPVRGVPRALRTVLGSIITPNMLLPRWWLEGFAVEYETRFSLNGRLRSKYQEGTLRSLVLSPRWTEFSVSELNEQSLTTWPHGARPYLFGSLIMSEILSKSSEQFMDQLTQRYGGRMPYFITAPIKEQIGHSYESLFFDVQYDLDKRVRKQMQLIRQIPESKTTALLDSSEGESENPSISPDGRYLALVAVDKYGERSIRLFDRKDSLEPFDSKKHAMKELEGSIDEKSDGGQISLPRGLHLDSDPIHDGPPTGSIGRISWFPNSKKFIYEKVSAFSPYLRSSDLHIFDIEKQKAKALTKGARVREPAISPDGKKITFIQLGHSKTSLGIADENGKNLKVIYSPEILVRLSSPVFLDANTILFSERDLKGNEQLKRISLDGKITPLQLSVKNPLYLEVQNQNLVFTGETQGMTQIFTSPVNGLMSDSPITAEKRSHIVTFVAKATLDPRQGDLYVTQMSDRGFEVAHLGKANQQTADLPTELPGLFADRYPKKEHPLPLGKDPIQMTEEDYSAASYLLPRYWLPTFYFDNSGYGIQAITSANDPLGKHAYQFQGGYDSFTDQKNIAVNYLNHTTPVSIGVLGVHTLATEIVTLTEYQTTQGRLSGAYPFWNIAQGLEAGLAVEYLQSETDVSQKRQGPQFFINLDATTQNPYHYTASSGWAGYYELSQYKEDWGDYGFERSKLNLTKYISKGLADGHVIKTEFHGVYTPQRLPILEAQASQGYPFVANLLYDGFVMRGYSPNYFIFKSAANLNLEYRIPLGNIHRGFGTNPLYFRRIHAAWVLDAITLDGLKRIVNTERGYEPTLMNQYYYSTGAEIKLDLTFGYNFPITMFFGVYKLFNNGKDPSQISPQIGFQL